MKTRLMAMSLLLALAATGAAADTRHYATASTKKEAKRLATADARAMTRVSALCFRPARQVNACVKVEGGFRCRADSSASFLTCRHAGWMRNPNPNPSVAWANWATDSWPSNPWTGGAGPPQPPPFPSN